MIEETSARLLWAVMIGVPGLAVGSFLNVVIARVPLHLSVVRPRSRCPKCESPIRPFDNIPVVSWFVLRGRCRSCGASIPVRYPLVELVTGLLFGAAAWKFQMGWELAGFLLLIASLVAIALIDLEHYIVPNRILIPVVPASVALLAIAAALDGQGTEFVRALAGGALAFVGLLVVHLISPRGMGMGDVKLAFPLGLFLGWLSWGHVALGLFLGFLLGAVAGVALMASGVRSRKEAVPFAPFLAAGTLLAVFVGQPILDWYAGF